MRPRATLALTTLALLAAPAVAGLHAKAAPPGTSRSPGAAPRTDEVSRVGQASRDGADTPASQGLAWTLPAGWRDVHPRVNDLGSPKPQLAAATFAVGRGKPDRDCRLDHLHAQVPAGGALVLLLEDREAAARPRALERLPRRRAPLGAPRPHECFGMASVVQWTEQGRALLAVALFGQDAARGQAEALLRSLTVQAIAPPPPPAGWRVVVSGAYDSIRVPPGWTARALKHPRTAKRPRLLFRLAGPDGAVLGVTEQRRGPASAAFPPASEPLVFDARHRAGLSFRGYRFSLQMRAPAHEAEIAARSLGVSGAGRG